jgi:type IV secretion system protein VirB5
MRALVTVYTVASTSSTTEEQIRNNPLGIYVRDFSWSRQL